MPDTGKFIITYAHERAGTFYSATLTEINGTYRVTWTIAKGPQEKERDCLVTQEQFKSLWNDIADNELFHRHAALDPNATIDFKQFHIIGVAFDLDGEQGAVTHRIPRREADPTFKSWLKTLETTYTQRPADL